MNFAPCFTVAGCSKMRIHDVDEGRDRMFCPRCAQPCATDVRFCSRCGLPLDVIAEVTANQGIAVIGEGHTALSTKPPAIQGTRIGTILMLAAVALSPLFFALSVLADGPAPLLAPVTLFLTGLCFVLYSRAFREHPPVIVNRPHYPVLTPQSKPVSSFPDRSSISAYGPRKVNTSDMAEPPSITDHTTQFFD
jgi:hypothetical protein